MSIVGNRRAFLLLLGDAASFGVALWLSLFVRYGGIPGAELLSLHAGPFAALFALWILVFFIFDLYGRQRAAFRRKLFSTILSAQAVNAILSVCIFYFVPFVGIAPKTNLFLVMGSSFTAVLAWRLLLAERLYQGSLERVAILGGSHEAEELRGELSLNPKYGYAVVSLPVLDRAALQGVSLVAVDLHSSQTESHRALFYEAFLSGVSFIDIRTLYEQIFDRVPSGLLEEGWLLENVPARSKFAYDALKRLMDITIALPLFLASLLVYPFAMVAIWLEDGRPFFVSQERVGRGGKVFRMLKFRSMTGSDAGAAVLKSERQVTRVGSFLRKSRIDEVPQLLSVLEGSQSLVGPRPELPALADVYRAEIPYYDLRHSIQPGLSGWAQIYHENHPHHGTAVDATREKLSYDLFYVKHRSFVLDLKIALKTLKTLASFVGR